jgi:hypothetical protein
MTTDTAALESGPQSKAKVFISYSRQDEVFAQWLREVLKARGIEVFRDVDDTLPSEKWWERLQSLIVAADSIVFVLSPRSATSKVCQEEVAYADSLKKRIFPAVIEDVDWTRVPPGLASRHSIFFIDEPQRTASVDQLYAALLTDIEWIREHTRLLERAIIWQQKASGRYELLSGRALEEAERWLARKPASADVPTALHLEYVKASRDAATHRRNVLTASLATGLLLALALAGLAYWQREVAIEQELIAQEQRAIASKNETEAKEQRDQAIRSQAQSDSLRLFFQAQSLAAEGHTEEAQLIALELFESINRIESVVRIEQLYQLYYDIFSSLFVHIDKWSTNSSRTNSPAPAANLSAQFVKSYASCDSAKCERLRVSDPSYPTPLYFDCSLLSLCHESSFAKEGSKRIIPHPYLPIALIEIYGNGDWRLFNLKDKTISNNIFPSQLVCGDEYDLTQEAFFIGKGTILWRVIAPDRRGEIGIVATDYGGRISAVNNALNTRFQPASDVTEGTLSILRDDGKKMNGGEKFYRFSETAPFLNRFLAGADNVIPREKVRELLGNDNLIGQIPGPGDELAMAGFNVVAKLFKGEHIGLRYRRCLVSIRDDFAELRTLYCLKHLQRTKEGGHQFDIVRTEGGDWLISIGEAGLEAWRIYESLSTLVSEGKEHIARCLTPAERRALSLTEEPPRWCITGGEYGSENSSEPAHWEPKWPYDTQEWKDWLSAKQRGESWPRPEVTQYSAVEQEIETFRAARGDLDRLRGYVSGCTVCTFEVWARDEINFLLAGDIVDRLRAYVRDCQLCWFKSAAFQKISELEKVPREVKFVIYKNRDLYGGDYKRIDSIDFPSCESICSSNSLCVSYSFDRWNHVCFLKSSVSLLRIEPRSTTGVRHDIPAPSEVADAAIMQKLRGKRFPGNGYGTLRGSFESCEATCKKASECVAYSLVKTAEQCTLFSETGEYFSDNRVDSGIKIQPARK